MQKLKNLITEPGSYSLSITTRIETSLTIRGYYADYSVLIHCPLQQGLKLIFASSI